ncbi:DgyrCDS14047 [Dimorphilus gyrociliatus]|uniref:DgyrCDS14047 n=1 Tax=Dimorphilus gyrociliatus TaxID=2664684 RepID=A0A7I8WCE2_9ANNE|nr:DgyrCDS14047 [Dimorphilus gyrociliatus]
MTQSFFLFITLGFISVITPVRGRPLLFSTRHSIELLDNVQDSQPQSHNIEQPRSPTIYRLSFHFYEHDVYWASLSKNDKSTIYKRYVSTNSSSSERKKTVVLDEDLGTIEGLAVDWMANNIYWTDSEKNRIEVAKTDGTLRKVLIHRRIFDPKDIVLDLDDGYMYWINWYGRPNIEKTAMDGSTRKVLVEDDNFMPRSLAIWSRKLYWTEMNSNSIKSIGVDGNGKKSILQTAETPYALDVIGSQVLWSQVSTSKNEVYKCTLMANGTDVRCYQSHLIYETKRQITSLRIFSHLPQMPTDKSACNSKRGNCSHLCLIAPSPKSFSCTCPTGLARRSASTCASETNEMLLVAQRSRLLKISLDTTEFIDICLPLVNNKNRYFNKLAYDALSNRLFAVDGKLIKSIHLRTLEERIVVDDPKSETEELDIDWIGGNLYWIDSFYKRIQASTLNGTHKVVVVSDGLEDPHSLAIHSPAAFLYWVDGLKIERSYLDGSNRSVLFEGGDIQPRSLKVDCQGDKLYWFSSASKSIITAALDGTNRKVLIKLEHQISSLEVYNGYAYWIDILRSLKRISLKNDSNITEILADKPDMRDLIAFRVGDARCTVRSGVSGGDVCKRRRCSYICLRRSTEGVCKCPSGFYLSGNAKTCIKSDAFLLYAAQKRLHYFSLNDSTQNFITMASTAKNAIALSFDPIKKKVYWIDSINRIIVSAYLNGSGEEIVIKTGLENPIDLTIDWLAQNLYWIDSRTKRVELSAIDGSARRVLFWNDINNLTSLLVDPYSNFVYFAHNSYSKTKPIRLVSALERSGADGTNRRALIQNKEGTIHSLTIDYENSVLYWADSDSGLIQYSDLDGKNVRNLPFSDIDYPVGLAIYSDSIYWIEKRRKTIVTANKKMLKAARVIKQTSANDLLILQPPRKPIDGDSCKQRHCSDICVRVGNNSSRCLCSTHYKLREDGNCERPKEFLVVGEKTKIYRYVPDDASPTVPFPFDEVRNVRSVTYDSSTNSVFWIDGRRNVILKATDSQNDFVPIVLWKSEDPSRFKPSHLVVNPYSSHLYVIDGRNNSIYIIRTDTGERVGTILLSTTDKKQRPRQMAIDTINGYIFWTSLLPGPSIWRASLDGKNALRIVSGETLEKPIAIAVDPRTRKVFWSDVSLGQIESTDYDGGQRKVIVSQHLSEPRSLAILGEWLYWSERKKGLVERIRLSNNSDRTKILAFEFIAGLSSVSAIDYNHPCKKPSRKCSHICLPERGFSDSSLTSKCSCPLDLTLSGDRATCTEAFVCAENYIRCKDTCIVDSWRCDGFVDCEDGSDEKNCPECPIGQWSCRSKPLECIGLNQLCDGQADCLNSRDESDANCRKRESCPPGNFMCDHRKACIPKSLHCDGIKHCSDYSDERKCNISKSINRPSSPHRAQIIIIIIVAVALKTFIVIVIVVACRRQVPDRNKKKKTTYPTKSVSNVTSTRNEMGLALPDGHSKDSPHSTLLPDVLPQPAPDILYDRGHVTGCSSTSSSSTPLVDPPPSPVTTTYSSRKPHRSKKLRKKHYITPPNYTSGFYPNPPTPRSSVQALSVSPSTERSFYNNPYPPPPSPIGFSD